MTYACRCGVRLFGPTSGKTSCRATAVAATIYLVALLMGDRDMARIKGIEPRDAGLMTRLVYWFVERKMRQVTGKARLIEPIKVMAHHPRLMKAVGQMETGQAAAQSVPGGLKALASVKTSMLIGCARWMDIGLAVGRTMGVTEQQLQDLDHFESSPAFSELEKLVLRYAEAMAQIPVEVPDELYYALEKHFNPTQMVELTSAIAWEN